MYASRGGASSGLALFYNGLRAAYAGDDLRNTPALLVILSQSTAEPNENKPPFFWTADRRDGVKNNFAKAPTRLPVETGAEKLREAASPAWLHLL